MGAGAGRRSPALWHSHVLSVVFWLASRRAQIVTRRHNTIVVERRCRRVDQTYRQQRVHHETSISCRSSLRRYQRDGTCRRPWCIGQHRPARFLRARGHRGLSAAAAQIYQRPVVIERRVPVSRPPIYLNVPPGQAKTLAPTLRRLQCLWRTGLFRAETVGTTTNTFRATRNFTVTAGTYRRDERRGEYRGEYRGENRGEYRGEYRGDGHPGQTNQYHGGGRGQGRDQ
jgi:hypothetical protein